MRTIKFRAKDFDGVWHYGSLVYSDKIDAVIYFQTGKGSVKSMDWVYVNQETIGQFTGLKDENGNEIYEGDILKWNNGRLYVVKFWRGMFYASVEECNEGILGGFPLHRLTEYEDEKCEIVGNIYDNPEMKKKYKEIIEIKNPNSNE